MAGAVACHFARCEIEVAGPLHVHQVRREVEHEGGIQLTPLNWGGALQLRPEVQTEDVHDLYSRLIGSNGAERFQVCLTGLGRENQKLAYACPLLPRLDKFIHHTVKCTPPQRGTAGERSHRGVDAVLDGRGAGNAVGRRQIVR